MRYRTSTEISSKLSSTTSTWRPLATPNSRRRFGWLVLSTVLYVRCMYDWFDEQQWPMQFCAWAARNLFELEIWTRYVLTKKDYADRFAKDWIMDGIGILESFSRLVGITRQTA